MLLSREQYGKLQNPNAMSAVDNAILEALDGPSSSNSSESDSPSEPNSDDWGPAFYDRRRWRWISSGSRDTPVVEDRERPSIALEKLEQVLKRPGVLEDDDIWDRYLKTVHSKLVGGTTVRKGMSLSYAIKILQAGWLRDGTWTGEDIQIAAQEEGSRFRTITTTAPAQASTAYVPPWMTRVEDAPRQVSEAPKKKSSRKRGAPPSLDESKEEDEMGATSDAERGAGEMTAALGGQRSQVKRTKSDSVNSVALAAENRPEHDGRAEGG